MAILLKWRVEGVTPQQYDEVRRLAKWETDVPEGEIFHAVSMADNAWEGVDIWESQDDFDQFLQNRLQPAFQQVGVTSQPRIASDPVYRIFPAAFMPKPAVMHEDCSQYLGGIS